MESNASPHPHTRPPNDGDGDTKTTPKPSSTPGFICGRTVVPVPNRNHKPQRGRLDFVYAEHCFIGDATHLSLPTSPSPIATSSHPFTLPNGLSLTFGQINALAGDLYGTSLPISSAPPSSDDPDASLERTRRFLSALDTLIQPSPRQPAEALSLLAVLQSEVDAVNTALRNHADPSVIYATLPDSTLQLEALTITRPEGQPSYVGLAQVNFDHFGMDARVAYDTGHAEALRIASEARGKGEGEGEEREKELEKAYIVDAFACHFLEDSFAAGHMRTPRRALHDDVDPAADLCAKYMHDEDNALGLLVSSPSSSSSSQSQWMAYGDKMALDPLNAENLSRCVDAVQASIDEVYLAFKTGEVPEGYKAWMYAPTLESVGKEGERQRVPPLFELVDAPSFNLFSPPATESTPAPQSPQTQTQALQLERRKIIEDRTTQGEYTQDFWFWTTVGECVASGLWEWPIEVTGPSAPSTGGGGKGGDGAEKGGGGKGDGAEKGDGKGEKGGGEKGGKEEGKGRREVLKWSSIAVVHGQGGDSEEREGGMRVRVVYQRPDGTVVCRSVHDSAEVQQEEEGEEEEEEVCKAVRWTPLAAVSWGSEVRLYSVSEGWVVQEHVHVYAPPPPHANGHDTLAANDTETRKGSHTPTPTPTPESGTTTPTPTPTPHTPPAASAKWTQGPLTALAIQVAPNTAVAACCLGGRGVRVFYQGTKTNGIKELCFDASSGKWTPGAPDLPIALKGSSIAATACVGADGEAGIRVVYQDEELELREHVCKGGVWSSGSFNPGKVPGCTPLSICAEGKGNVEVFWRGVDGSIVHSSLPSSSPPATTPTSPSQITGEATATRKWTDAQTLTLAHDLKIMMTPGTHLVASSSTAGKMRVFYQDETGAIVEISSSSSGGGGEWTEGRVVVPARRGSGSGGGKTGKGDKGKGGGKGGSGKGGGGKGNDWKEMCACGLPCVVM